eukprot:CAMPEP_0181032382 /NCGR_PEP_ID=MMETSP1070-20121207/6713_1 /TAXON_ID=265543 /ORGANISM="Minutocellus polymorphus, Strain NH13" /LENGTH=647 /DNA_ID=CAMNT_0023109777 /DNA_START=140 /DNA_END=2083 /DNA_ORIENTATION=-
MPIRTGSSSGLAAAPTPAPPPSSASSAASRRRPSSTTRSGLSGPAVIASLVIGLGLCLNLMNLGFLTLDHSSTHDYHTEIITHLLGFGEGGKHHIRIKDDDEDTDVEGGGGGGGPDDDDINLDDDKVLGEIEKVEDLLDADESMAAKSGHLDEVHAFKKVISRAVANLELCNSLPKVKGPPAKEVQQITDTPMLSEFGIMNALSEWIGKVEGEKNANNAAGQHRGNNDEATAYPVCHLPPASSCQTRTYTAVLMSHATDRLKKLKGGVVDLCGRGATEEVILVWNSPRSLLESDSGGIGQELLGWDKDPSHKMRIFFALENGLENNLLNRYHPSIKPKSEAVMFFDDDGPFFDERAMSKVGFELWRRNSDVQNAAFPRNLRVLSDRMKDMQKQGLDLYLKSILERSKGRNGDAEEGEVDDIPFTPTCRERTGDIIEYNFFVFPQFGANMALPSGSIIHRNYLCFIWHPAFEELRKFIREHPTHPDDQTVSAIISQLSGKPPRAFPRTIKKGKTEDKANLRGGGGSVVNSKATNSTKRRRLLASEEEYIDDGIFLTEEEGNQLHVDQNHRRLLWQQKNWGPMREEAANSLIGYFGSLNAGSIGWCAGTQYQKKQPRSPGGFSCDPEFPTLDMVPWIKHGGLGFDICTD